jgi:ABC-type glycerol-3-phosphate transport system permease component
MLTRLKKLGAKLSLYALVLLFVAFAVFPFYWMTVSTFKRNEDLFHVATDPAHNPYLFNLPPTLEHLTPALLRNPLRHVRAEHVLRWSARRRDYFADLCACGV